MKIATVLLTLLLSTFAFADRMEVEVNGMTCGMCVESITKELKATDKLENINVSLENMRASFSEIKGKKINNTDIRAAIKKAGYEAGKITRK